MKKRLILLGLLTFFAVSVSTSARTKQVTKEIESEGVDRIEITAELGAGEFRIEPRDMDQAAIIDISYNPKRNDYEVDYNVSRSTGYLNLESDHRKSSDIDTDDNEWDIVLSTRYESTLELEIGACEADIDLGGIPLEEFALEIGAASGRVVFSEPNPIRMKEISIEAGASSLDLEKMGNANFDQFRFEGGVGSFTIDLSGEYNGESEVDIEIGLGSAEIYLPDDVAVRIETSGSNWLSSVDIHGRDFDEIDDDLFETEDFDSADNRIILVIEVGLGSVDIYRK
ncbi:MAG: LiaF-related protein [bacterium]|nr:LiaF-related protein [bacterium]